MSDKLRNAFAVLMGFLIFIGIVLGVVTNDESLYVPFIILTFILSGIIFFSKREEKDDNRLRKSSRMTAQKASIWALFYFWLAIIMGLITNFSDIIFLPILGVACIFRIMFHILDIKEQKYAFEIVILDMRCTEDMISDQEMISEIEKFLAMDRADFNLKKRDKNGKTMLIHAARHGRAKVVKYLLDRGADIYARDYDSFSALHAGVMSKDLETIKLLLMAGAEINAKDSLGYSPIMLADFTTDLEVFRILMAYGANPEQKNKYGVTAMDMFAQSPEILEILSQR